jgi:hypothetical protein
MVSSPAPSPTMNVSPDVVDNVATPLETATETWMIPFPPATSSALPLAEEKVSGVSSLVVCGALGTEFSGAWLSDR